MNWINKNKMKNWQHGDELLLKDNEFVKLIKWDPSNIDEIVVNYIDIITGPQLIPYKFIKENISLKYRKKEYKVNKIPQCDRCVNLHKTTEITDNITYNRYTCDGNIIYNAEIHKKIKCKKYIPKSLLE